MSAELYAPIIIVGVFGYFGLAAMVCVWPWLGYGLLVTVPLVKSLLRFVAGGLLAGYTYDLAMAFLAMLGALVHKGRYPSMRSAPVPASLVFCWFSLAFLLWARSIGVTNVDWAVKKSLIFSIFLTLAISALPAFLLSPREGRWLLRIVMFSGLLASFAMPLYGAATDDYESSRISLGRTSPLFLANLSVNAIIILLCGLIAKRNTVNLAMSVVFIPLCLLAIFMTGTRGPIFAIPVLVPIILWFYRRRLNFQAAMTSLVGLGAVVAATVFIVDPEKLYRFTPEKLTEALATRVHMSMVSILGFVSSPIIGTGTGTTAAMILGKPDVEYYPHNHLLEVGCELGLLGLAAWAVIIGAGLRSGWSLMRPEWEGTEAKYVGVPIYVAFLYYLLMSFKMGSFSADFLLYFFLFASVILHQLRTRDMSLWHQYVSHQNRQRLSTVGGNAAGQADPAMGASAN
jgi:hypothetical protein